MPFVFIVYLSTLITAVLHATTSMLCCWIFYFLALLYPIIQWNTSLYILIIRRQLSLSTGLYILKQCKAQSTFCIMLICILQEYATEEEQRYKVRIPFNHLIVSIILIGCDSLGCFFVLLSCLYTTFVLTVQQNKKFLAF